jgi:hypothetical protein
MGGLFSLGTRVTPGLGHPVAQKHLFRCVFPLFSPLSLLGGWDLLHSVPTALGHQPVLTAFLGTGEVLLGHLST